MVRLLKRLRSAQTDGVYGGTKLLQDCLKLRRHILNPTAGHDFNFKFSIRPLFYRANAAAISTFVHYAGKHIAQAVSSKALVRHDEIPQSTVTNPSDCTRVLGAIS